MTFTLTNFEDDQMVPQGGYSVDSGLVEDIKPALPDLETLLSDINSTLEHQAYSQPAPLGMDSAPLGEAYSGLELEQPFGFQDELTLYDDMPTEQKPNIIELQKQMNLPLSDSPMPSREATTLTVMPVAVSHDSEMDEARREVDSVCHELGIPADPYAWTVVEVQKWAAWSLKQYNLPADHAHAFNIDGTTLCMMPEAEFQRRFPQVGQYLFAQLEFWRNAYNLTSVTTTSANVTSSVMTTTSDTKTFTDLSPMTSSNPIVTLASLNSVCTQPSLMFSSTVYQAQPSSSSQNGMMFSQTVTTPSSEALPLNIPKCVFSSVPNTLSPASSVDSQDSSTSSLGSNTSFVSESVPQEMEVGGARARVPTTSHRNGLTPTKQNIHLWQFLRELLLQPEHFGSSIRWLNRSEGIFKIEDSVHVARLWGQRKNRPAMNYDKLSRSIRQYYKKGIIKKTNNSKRLVYQFCPQYRV